jgi:hypothetical protein
VILALSAATSLFCAKDGVPKQTLAASANDTVKASRSTDIMMRKP